MELFTKAKQEGISLLWMCYFIRINFLHNRHLDRHSGKRL